MQTYDERYKIRVGIELGVDGRRVFYDYVYLEAREYFKYSNTSTV